MTMPDSDRANQGPETRENPPESQWQVDPLLREGPASRWRIWATGIVVAVLAILVFYTLTERQNHRPAQDQYQYQRPAPERPLSGPDNGLADRARLRPCADTGTCPGAD